MPSTRILMQYVLHELRFYSHAPALNSLKSLLKEADVGFGDVNLKQFKFALIDGSPGFHIG
jgi:hypothetical protein